MNKEERMDKAVEAYSEAPCRLDNNYRTQIRDGITAALPYLAWIEEPTAEELSAHFRLCSGENNHGPSFALKEFVYSRNSALQPKKERVE